MNFGLACCIGAKYFDFMSTVAAVPRPALAMGFDSVGGPFKVVFAPGGFEKWEYSVFANVFGSPHGFYREMEVIEEYEEGCSITTTTKAYPYFYNPCDTDDHIVNGTANGTNPATDFRLTGIPASYETTTKVVTVGDWTAGGTRDIASFDQIVQMMLAYDDHPPTFVDEDHVIFHYSAEWLPTTAPYPVSLKTRTVTLRGKMTDAELQEKAEALLVPLIANSIGTTREGPIAFDYFGTDATYPQPPRMNRVPPGAVYDGSGNCTITVEPDQLYGITVGSNDATLADYSVIFPDFTVDNSSVGPWFPYHWPDGGAYDYRMSTPIKPTIFIGGVNNYNGVSAAVADTSVFCSHLSTVRLGGGVPGAPVTARITPTHSNLLLAFPLRGGTVFTVQYDNPPPIAMRMHTGYSPNYGIGYGSGLDGRLQGFIAAAMRVRIPVNPLSKTDDVTFFRSGSQWGITSYIFPTNAVSAWLATDTAYNLNEQFITLLPPGEHLFYPGDIISDTGWGWLHFTDGSAWTDSVAGAGTSGLAAGDSGAGSTTQNGGL